MATAKQAGPQEEGLGLAGLCGQGRVPSEGAQLCGGRGTARSRAGVGGLSMLEGSRKACAHSHLLSCCCLGVCLSVCLSKDSTVSSRPLLSPPSAASCGWLGLTQAQAESEGAAGAAGPSLRAEASSLPQGLLRFSFPPASPLARAAEGPRGTEGPRHRQPHQQTPSVRPPHTRSPGERSRLRGRADTGQCEQVSCLGCEAKTKAPCDGLSCVPAKPPCRGPDHQPASQHVAVFGGGVCTEVLKVT